MHPDDSFKAFLQTRPGKLAVRACAAVILATAAILSACAGHVLLLQILVGYCTGTALGWACVGLVVLYRRL